MSHKLIENTKQERLSVENFDTWFENAEVEHNDGNEYLLLIDDYEESISIKVDEPVSATVTKWITDVTLTKSQAERVFQKVEDFINSEDSECDESFYYKQYQEI